MRLSRRPEAFDSEEFIYELKIDGFRALAYIENRQCDLVSRNGDTFRNFKHLAGWSGENLRVESAVLDGEIACLDDSGRRVFNDLLFRRRECVFFAFDLLFLNGEEHAGAAVDREESPAEGIMVGSGRSNACHGLSAEAQSERLRELRMNRLKPHR